tara:strand:- start:56 stop:481 length:426 start_codon:yes stop_codon:yes gene_type:complete
MAKYKIRNHYSYQDDGTTIKSSYQDIEDTELKLGIPLDSGNRYYQQYFHDIRRNGVSIVSCDDCGDGTPNDSMWQYLDNAEQLVIDKYGSDSDKLTALREHRYVRAMEAKIPYKSKDEGLKIINSTSEEIKQKYRHLPMRR